MNENGILLLKYEYKLEAFCSLSDELHGFELVDCCVGYNQDIVIIAKRIVSEDRAVKLPEQEKQQYQLRIIQLHNATELTDANEADLDFSLFDINIQQPVNIVRAYNDTDFLLAYTGNDKEQENRESYAFLISPSDQDIKPLSLPAHISDIQITADQDIWITQDKKYLANRSDQPVLIGYDKSLKPSFEFKPKESLNYLASAEALNVAYDKTVLFSGSPHYPIICKPSTSDFEISQWYSPLTNIHRLAVYNDYLLVDAGTDNEYQFLLLELDKWSIAKIVLEVIFQDKDGRNIKPEFTYTRDRFLIMLQQTNVYIVDIKHLTDHLHAEFKSSYINA